MLTKSQQKVYDYLKSRTRDGLRSTSSVHAHLKTLEREGYIIRDPGLNRAIHIVGERSAVQVPIVGRVAAGQPILAEQHIEGYVPFSPPHGSGEEYFALNVRGDSMKMAGILNGDIVVARQTSTVHDGEIAVALIEDEATVKTFYHDKDCIRLQPENPDYQPIYVTDVTILGRVVAVVRYY